MDETQTAQHTPGPWKVKGPSNGNGLNDDGGDFAIYIQRGGADYIIAEAFRVTGKNDFEAADANARLIAAAPDYHRAAQLAQDSQGPSDNEHVVISREAYGALFDAHAKAEGRA